MKSICNDEYFYYEDDIWDKKVSADQRKANYRCKYLQGSILKCHRKKNKMQLPGGKHPQVPQKEKQDTITGQQASSSAIERKNKMQSPDSKHLQVP